MPNALPTARAAACAPAAAELRTVMGLRCWDVALEHVADFLVARARAGERVRGYFVNAHCINVAAGDRHYAQLLAAEPFVFADGAGMALAARLCGTRLAHNVNGTDLFPRLCAAAAAAGVPLALLGARPGVAQECAARMQARYPGLQFNWVADGYLPEPEERARLSELNASGARLLLVAKGVPAQEHWIAAHAAQLTAPVVLGVGALFDFYSGSMARAPLLLRRLRVEWLYRLCREPRRLFRRYVVGNPEFLLRALRWRWHHGAERIEHDGGGH